MSASGRTAHGELANRIVGQGNVVKTEKISYVASQKSFGRSVKVRALGSPGGRPPVVLRSGQLLRARETIESANWSDSCGRSRSETSPPPPQKVLRLTSAPSSSARLRRSCTSRGARPTLACTTMRSLSSSARLWARTT